MAEYIDRERFREVVHRNTTGDLFDRLIDMQPAADVVGQEKIDKAIEEGYEIRRSILQSNDNYTANDVLDIIDEILDPFEELYEEKEGNK